MGGSIGPMIKATGHDYITITGAAASPVVVHITPQNVEFLDASELWGKGVFETLKGVAKGVLTDLKKLGG